MDAIVLVGGLVVLGVLAVRFGHDSRQRLGSSEHQMALAGATWNDPVVDSRPEPRDLAPRLGYPILTLIEQTLGLADGALTDSPDADTREARARSVAYDAWSEWAWVTGVVPAAAFQRLMDEVAPELAPIPHRATVSPSMVEPVAAVQTDPTLPAAEARSDGDSTEANRSQGRLPTLRPATGAPAIAS